MGILFVSGCARSGTTALVDYLNYHPEVLVCRERYKYVAERITPEFFTAERILDYTPRHRRGESNMPWEHHAELVAGKDLEKVKWIGDKYPGYVRSLVSLLGNNPGARFIFTYRPLEEVVESYVARSRNPEDPWLGGRDGFELGVEHWNRAMRNIRDFVEGGLAPESIVVSYTDFFSDSETYAPLLSRFLELEFDEDILSAWREMSSKFAGGRRSKDLLSEKQIAVLQERKDEAAEAWMLDRIKKQWTDPEIFQPSPPESGKRIPESARSLRELELSFKARGLRIQELERTLRKTQGESPGEKNLDSRKSNEALAKENRRLASRVQNLERRLRSVESSRSWRLLVSLGRVRNQLVNRGREYLGGRKG